MSNKNIDNLFKSLKKLKDSLSKARLKPGEEHLAGMLNDNGSYRETNYPLLSGRKSGKDPKQAGSHVSSLFKDLEDAHAAGSDRAVKHHSDRLKDFLKHNGDDVDLSHFSNEYNQHQRNLANNGSVDRQFIKDDALKFFDKKVAGNNTLKDVVNKHGIDAAKGIVRLHGVNVNPYHFEDTGHLSEFHGKNTPNLEKLAGDTHAAVDGVYGNHRVTSSPNEDGGLYEASGDYSTAKKLTDSQEKRGSEVHDNFEKKYEEAFFGDGDGDPTDEKHKMDDVNDALADRFEHHHDIAHGVKKSITREIMAFKDRKEFEEALAKSVEGMQEELEKAAPNVGGSSNDASGKTPQRIEWAKKTKKLESEVDRLQDLSDKKADDESHPIHATLSRAQKELETHYDSHPDKS
jgi:hypothetical protein